MSELLNRTFFNLTLTFISIVLLMFIMALVLDTMYMKERDERTIPLQAG